MKKLNESKLAVLQQAVNEITDEKVTTEKLQTIIRNSRKTNETLRMLFEDFRKDKVVEIELLNEVQDKKLNSLLKTYLAMNNYSILDVKKIESEAQEEQIEDLDIDEQEMESFMSSDNVKIYLKEVGKTVLMTAEEEQEMFKKYNECKNESEKLAIKKEITERNSKLVVSVAKRYVGRGLLFLDLIQEGNLGLIKSIDKFDVTKGYKFSTYATWWIRQSVTRAIADHARTIRIPVHMVEKINKVVITKKRLTQELLREPTDEEIAEELNLTLDKVRDLLRISQEPVSLESPVGQMEHGTVSTILDFIVDEEYNVETEAMNVHLKKAIKEVLNDLSPREAEVIRLRFGIDDDIPKTLEQVGHKFGVTRERIRQIEAKALRKLRHPARTGKLRVFLEKD